MAERNEVDALQERLDNLVDHVTDEDNDQSIKSKLNDLLSRYEQQKGNLHEVVELKDEFNQLMFYLVEVLASARDIKGRATLLTETNRTSIYFNKRAEVNPETKRLYSEKDADRHAKYLNATAYILQIGAEMSFSRIYGYYDTCKSYRDACIQRIKVLGDESFTSRQQQG